MWLLGTEAVRQADRDAMEAGLSGLTLMETAGRTAAALLLAVAGAPDARHPAVILAGSGNNGGDGLVLARWLARWVGPEGVRVYLAADPARLRGEAAIQWRLLGSTGVAARWPAQPAGAPGRPPAATGDGTGDRAGAGGVEMHGRERNGEAAFLSALRQDAARARVAVDALLGVGARGALRPLAAAALEALAAGGAPILALDLPSGLDPDTGEAAPATPRARWTATFGAPKWGLVLRDGPARAGRVFVIDIGWPAPGHGGDTAAGEQGGAVGTAGPAGGAFPGGRPYPPARLIDGPLAARLLPRRPVDAHKGSAGHVIVVGGRTGQAGAPWLAGRAALLAGAGAVTVAVPASLRPEVAGRSPALMTWPLPEREGAVAATAPAAVQALEGERRGRVVRVIGPGLGRGEGAAACLDVLLGLRARGDAAGGLGEAVPPPTVLDADGLNLVAAAGVERLRQRPGPFPLILTPHPGEAARLLDRSTAEVQAGRPAAARELAERAGAVVVLKGAGTLVAAPGGALFFCARGHPGMASAGMGDALAGVIGALLAQGLEAVDAAVLGVYLHALAGELAALHATGGAPGEGAPRPGGCAAGQAGAGLLGPGAGLGHGVPAGPALGGPGDFEPVDGGEAAAFVPVTADRLLDHLPRALALCARGWPAGDAALGLPGVAWLRPPLVAGRPGPAGSEV